MANTYNSVNHALLEIGDTIGGRYGWEASVVKSINKWGQNMVVDGTIRTVWNSPGVDENYLSANTIDSIVCTDTNFTGVARIEGHTIDNNELTFVVQIVTLTGQTAVTLVTPLARMTRIRLQDETALALAAYISGYDSSQTTITAGVPQTDAGVYCTCRGGQYRTSEKAATAIDKNSCFLIQQIRASVGADKTGTVRFYFQQRRLGQEFYADDAPFYVSSANPSPSADIFPSLLIVEPNSDFRILALRTTGQQAVTVTARVSGILVRNLRPENN